MWSEAWRHGKWVGGGQVIGKRCGGPPPPRPGPRPPPPTPTHTPTHPHTHTLQAAVMGIVAVRFDFTGAAARTAARFALTRPLLASVEEGGE